MAGGDGSQAIVAAVAAEHGLPYACMPAGTRNHFALDLGVDRDDVVGALDAFVDGGERRVDLAEVNGRVFVNNVVARPVRRGGPARRLPRRQDPHPARHRARRARPRRQRARPALERARRSRTPRRRCRARLQQLLPARPRGRLGHPPAHRRRPARDHCRRARPPAAARTAVRSSGRGASGPPRPSRSTRGPFPPASTARRSSSMRRCAFGFGRGSSGCASPASTQAPPLGDGSRRYLGRPGRADTDRLRPPSTNDVNLNGVKRPGGDARRRPVAVRLRRAGG